LVLCLPLLAAPLASQSPPATSRPTVAVLYFTNSALVRRESYEPLSKGIADMLITDLVVNPAIRVVERDQLQKILEELNLNATGTVDKETALRLGKVLGAHHMLTGVFFVDPKETMRIDVRSVNVETSEVEYVESVRGKAENALDLISELAKKVNSGLHLPPMPTRTASADGSPAAESHVTPADRYRAFFLVSRSIDEQDKKNLPQAIALLHQALQIDPTYTHAQTRLASLERGGASDNR